MRNGVKIHSSFRSESEINADTFGMTAILNYRCIQMVLIIEEYYYE